MTLRVRPLRGGCFVVAHDHMRQHVCACDTRAHFRQHAKPLTYPKTGNAHNGASRRVDVVIDPYGVLRGACFAVGASIARPRYNPPPIAARRCKFVPGWVCEFASACCIFFVFTADGQWPPLHTGMCPALLVCSYGCTYVRNFSETPIRFFLRLSAILQLSGIPCKSPNKTRKPKHSEPRVIQKG